MSAAAAGSASATLTPAERGLLRAVNAARRGHGLRPVRLNRRLERASRAHSRDMLRRGYFGHGDFASRMLAVHAPGRSAGENLAWGTGRYAGARAIVRMWLRSPGHRRNLLSPRFTRMGVGAVRGAFLGHGGATVVTADFAG